MADDQWWWCLTHKRVEGEAGCPNSDRLGPFPTREAAEHWQDTVSARNQQWDREDADDS